MLSKEDWDRAAGVYCPKCYRETLRLQFVGKKKLCTTCFGKAQERIGRELEIKTVLRWLRRQKRRKMTTPPNKLREG